MREGEASRTAAYVAVWRALGDCLPPDVRLVHDPFGWSFAPPEVGWLRRLARRFPAATGRVLLASPLRRLLLWMQLRTRAIDDLTLDFVRGGGRQLLLLGAGFDCRALRLDADLAGVRSIEVDHPATQARKRAVLATLGVESGAAYLPWDFERDPLAELPARLAELGLDPTLPVLTIWEGVIPYLTEPAIEATLAALRSLGAEGSRVMLHYIERSRIEQRTFWHVAATRAGEPMRFGWEPSGLAGWLAARGYALIADRDDAALADALFPSRWQADARGFRGAGGRIAVARPVMNGPANPDA